MAELDTEENGTQTARLSCCAIERMVCEMWSEHFGRMISPYDDFFDLGGDSIALIDFVLAAQQRGLRMRSSDALRNSSPAQLAEILTVRAAVSPPAALVVDAREAAQAPAFDRTDDWTGVKARPVPIVVGGTGEPLCVVHSDSHVQAERDAVSLWGSERPVIGFPLPGARGPLPPSWSVGEIASRYLEALRTEQPAGPYRLAGFGHGAMLAFELARRLRGHGEQVALLALIEPPDVSAVAGPPADADPDELLRQRLVMLAGRFGLADDESLDEIHTKIRQDGWYDDSVHPRDLPRLQLVWAELASAARRYEIADYDGPVILFTGAAQPGDIERTLGRATGDLRVHRLDYGIESPIGVIHDTRLAQIMRKALKA
jgi:thioesterase domain-containing protein